VAPRKKLQKVRAKSPKTMPISLSPIGLETIGFFVAIAKTIFRLPRFVVGFAVRAFLI